MFKEYIDILINIYYKQILHLDLRPMPKIFHYIYANNLMLAKKQSQNLKYVCLQVY